jgi:hypothetical protein
MDLEDLGVAAEVRREDGIMECRGNGVMESNTPAS